MKKLLVIAILIAAAIGGAMYYDHYQEEQAALKQQRLKEIEEEAIEEAQLYTWEILQEAERDSLKPEYAVERVLESWRDSTYTMHDRSNKKLMSPSKWEVRNAMDLGNGEAVVVVYVTSTTQGGQLIHKDWKFLLSKDEDGKWIVHTMYDPNDLDLNYY